MTVEKLGIPTAPICTERFPDLATATATNGGMPYLRVSYCHHPVSNATVEETDKYMAANDTITGKPLLQEIVDALTKPLTADETKTGTLEVKRDRLLPADTEDTLKAFFYAKGYTDGLPFILPTEERVAALIKAGTSHKATEAVGKMAPSPSQGAWSYTVEQVAVNAVMAGATPELFPSILALASTAQPCLPSSTTSMLRWIVFNGPIRNDLKMNMSIGAMGPFQNQATALIGRSWQFISRNLGGSMPGTTYMGTLGNNYNYTNAVFGEYEEQLPTGWKPYAQQAGYKATDNILTVFGGWSFLNYGAYCSEPYHTTMRRMVNGLVEYSGTGGHFTPDVSIHQPVSIIIDPTAAKVLQQTEGYATKEALADWLYKNCFFTMWDYWQALPTNLKKAQAGEQPYADLLKKGDGDLSPEPIMTKAPAIVVTGGGTNPYWTMTDGGPSRSVNIDTWK
jgi:hypothetical protein